MASGHVHVLPQSRTLSRSEPDKIAARFSNRLPSSRTGGPFEIQNRTAGSQTGRPVPEPDKILDWDRTYICTKQYSIFYIEQVRLHCDGTNPGWLRSHNQKKNRKETLSSLKVHIYHQNRMWKCRQANKIMKANKYPCQ